MAHSKEYTKIMNSQRWQSLRNKTLKERPYCERCQCKGIQTDAQVIHHIKPIESGHSTEEYKRLAFDPDNLQSLCHQCHADIHRLELGSYGNKGSKMRNDDRHQRWLNDMIERFNKGG